jgi:pimeloyl-ACP methyl ester carboxylesterase
MQPRQVTAITSTLEIAYEESGPAARVPIVLLHGFPYAVPQYDAVRDELAASGQRVLVPCLGGFGPTRYPHRHTCRSGQQTALGKAGGNDGVEPPPEIDDKRDRFTEWYERRILPDAGHCVPGEAPQEVAAAIQRLLGIPEQRGQLRRPRETGRA